MNPIEDLTALAGTWTGSNTLHDPQTGQPEDSPSTVTVIPVLAGRFVRLDYTWGYRGKPQEGSILVGFEPKAGAISGHWVDTWHMGRLAMNCRGTAADGTLSIRGTYPAPPGPDWGWRIEITPSPFRIIHTNLFPDGREAPAAECTYRRGAFFSAAGPIGDTDLDALPVREIGPAVAYYTRCLGFTLVSRDATTARLRRDDVQLGLAVNGKDPEQASAWFAVGDVAALRQEYEARGLAPGPIAGQNHGGHPLLAFFARDCTGVCFCFTQPSG